MNDSNAKNNYLRAKLSWWRIVSSPAKPGPFDWCGACHTRSVRKASARSFYYLIRSLGLVGDRQVSTFRAIEIRVEMIVAPLDCGACLGLQYGKVSGREGLKSINDFVYVISMIIDE